MVGGCWSMMVLFGLDHGLHPMGAGLQCGLDPLGHLLEGPSDLLEMLQNERVLRNVPWPSKGVG